MSDAREEDRVARDAALWLLLLEDTPDDAEQLNRFQSWLDASPLHAQAWSRIGRTSALLAAAPANDFIRTESRFDRLRTRHPRRAAVAAVLAALILLPLVGKAVLRQGADYATGTGEIRTVQLADGSTCELGPRSKLSVSFAPDGRRVKLLSGEALFDVQHDPARPFTVEARDLTVTVLGTRFDVGVLGESASVSVSRGHVRAETGSGASFDLHPGDWVRANANGPTDQGSGLPEDLLGGPAPKIAARNRPVAEVIDEIRPWYHGDIVVLTESVGANLVTGVFDASDPGRALEALVGPQGGHVHHVTPWLLVVSKG